jgi:hypothetical protein
LSALATGQEGPPGPGLALPIGSIVSFWGDLGELPKAYELCDGELVTTPDSPLNGKRKPNLVDRFLKGAAPGVKDVREKPETGGVDSVTITHSHPAGHLLCSHHSKSSKWPQLQHSSSNSWLI